MFRALYPLTHQVRGWRPALHVRVGCPVVAAVGFGLPPSLPVPDGLPSVFSRGLSTASGPSSSARVPPFRTPPTSVRTRRVRLDRMTADGQVEKLNVPLSQLVTLTRLHARELLMVETASISQNPRLLPRRDCVLIAVAHVRMLLWKDQVFLFRFREDSTQLGAAKAFSLHLARVLKSRASGQRIRSIGSPGSGTPLNCLFDDDAPFEHVVLEAVLQSVTEKYSKRMEYSTPIVKSVIQGLSDGPEDPDAVYRLFPLQHSLQHFRRSTARLLDAVQVVLDDDSTLEQMCLTCTPDDRESHSEELVNSVVGLELLLENYHQLLSDILIRNDQLVANIQAQKSVLEIQMDNHRNHLLNINIRLSMLGVAIASGTFVSGTFGMNLMSGMESVPGLFYVVAAGCMGGGAMVFRHFLELSQRTSPSAQHTRRIKSLQRFLERFDSRTAAASTTLSTAPSSSLTKEEFKRVHEASAGRVVDDQEVDLLFDIFDSDNDGVITTEEVLQATVGDGFDGVDPMNAVPPGRNP